MKKRVISLLLAVVLIISMLPGTIVSATTTESTAVLTVEEPWSNPGGTVDVNLVITENPGVLGATLVVSWDESLTLVADASGAAFSHMTYTSPSRYTASGTNFVWFGNEVGEPVDGTVLTLTFEVPETAENNEILPIRVSYTPGDVVDDDDNDVIFSITDGHVRVITYQPGDVNGDARVNSRDLVRLSQYISDGNKTDPEGYNAEVVADACDVNGDGRVNARDLIRLSQYVSDGSQTDPEGYNAVLNPAKLPECAHTDMAATEAKAATCTEPGNHAYWYCADCGKYFSDENGNTEIALADTVISAAHKLTYVAACPATTETAGNIEHWFCGECNKYFTNSNATVEIEENDVTIPKLEKGESIVTYNIFGGDTYLESIGIENPNPSKFYAEDGLILNDLEAPDGYTFKGWTTASGTPITEIEPGSVRQITVNAVWSKTTYWVNFNSPLVPLAPISRTIDQTTTFEKQKLDGYTFIGWSDDSGNMISDYMIKPGTKDITLHANWTSNRNLTRPSKLGAPIIHFDEGNNQILFAYEIGTIENIPLYDLGYYEYIMAPTDITSSVTKSITIDEAAAKAISQAISNATTNTSAWTLSNEWTNSSSISEEHLHEMDSSVSSNRSSAFSESGTYNISTSNGGSTTTVVEAGVSAKVGSKVSNEASIGFPIDVINVGAKVSTEVSTEVGAELSTSQSDTKTWNTNEGYSASKEASLSHSLSSTLAQKISNSVSYNVSKSATESTSNSWSTATTSTDSREYASTFTYTTIQFEEETYTKTLKNAPAGHYRLVAAGTAHVFAVVTYDIATNAYGVYTYSIMEDEVKPFLDYSKESSGFNDNENGVLNFEVPYYVNNYVDSIIGATDGLVVNPNTGIIEEYIGTDDIVIIPQYMPVDNGDGTVTVVKITGFKANAFSGKSIKAVQLNAFIEEIPSSAFMGCDKLVIVQAPAVTKIGDKAFDGCISLKNYTVSEQVTILGSQAFGGVQNVTVNASNADVAKASVTCGAKSLTLNMASCRNALSNAKLEVPSTTEYFGFMGGTKTYEGVTISSKAKTTVINGANFINNNGTVLKFASENITLNRVNVETSSWAMILEAHNTNLSLQGEVNLNSSGANSVLSYNVAISKANANISSSLNVQGNMWVCGNVQGASYLNVSRTLTENINQDTYDQLLIGSLDWVLATEVPEGAQIVSEKWTYDLTTNITSDKSYVDGYTLYDTTFVWGETVGPLDYDPSNGVRNVWSEQYISSTTKHYKYYHWTDGNYFNNYQYNSNYKKHQIDITSALTYSSTGSTGIVWYKSYACPECGEKYHWVSAGEYDENHYSDRWYYQDPIYTYYHTKTETLESATEIVATEAISNVQKWVQYIVK